MKTILVFAHLYKPHLGGLEKYVEHFYKGIPGANITIITSQYLKNLPLEENDESLTIVRLKSIEIIKEKYFIPTLGGIRQILKLYKENKNKEVEIHTHTRFYFLYLLAIALSKGYGFIHYHFEHGSSFVKDGSLLIKAIAYLFDKTISLYILRNARKIFPVSKSVKEFLQRNYKNLNYGPIIYNSYEFKVRKIEIKRKPELIKLLFVGRIIKSKGIYELVDACKFLSTKNYPYSLTIIGDGSERASLEKYIIERNLNEAIEIKGSLPYEKTQKEYSKHDILINPSYTEGLPTTVLEALANGLLIVATDAGGTREIVDKNDLIPLEALSGDNIYLKIANIFRNWEIEYCKIIEQYSIAKNRFDIDINIQKYLKSTERQFN